MKGFKLADFFLQALLLVLLITGLLINDPEIFNPIYPIAGFAFLQLISIIVHGVAGAYTWKMVKARKIHQIGMLLVFLLLFIALLQDSGGRTGDKEDKYSMNGLGTLLLAVAPAILLALFYFFITCKEWLTIRKKNSTI